MRNVLDIYVQHVAYIYSTIQVLIS